MTDRGRIEWLDFLRGIAALAVVLFHVRVVLWVGLRALAADDTYPALDRALAWLALPAPFLGTAVMLFFVVSGFAIHWPYSAAGSPFALQPYAVRRFFRIYPPYLAAVAITVAAEYLIAAAGGAAPSPVAGTLATALMVQNYVSPAGQMGANPSLWSLPVEVELYLVYPLLLWLWRLAGTTVVVALVGAASLAAAVAFAFGAEWTTVNFAKYWIVWMAGAVLAQCVRDGTLPQWRRRHTASLCALLAAAIGARAVALPFAYEHFVWAAIYALVVFWGLTCRDPLARLAPPVRRAALRLGDISYSLYLIHFPILAVAGALWVAAAGRKPSNLLVPLAFVLLPIALAWAMWWTIERPSQSLGRAIAPGRPARLPAAPPAHLAADV